MVVLIRLKRPGSRKRKLLRKQTETAENNLDKIRFTEGERMEKSLPERGASRARLHEVVTALQRIIMCREEIKDITADVLSKGKSLIKQARPRVVRLRAVEMYELQEKTDKLDEIVEAKYLKLQTMQRLVQLRLIRFEKKPSSQAKFQKM